MMRIVKLVLGVLGGLLALCMVGSVVSGRDKGSSAPPKPAVATPPTTIGSLPHVATDAGATPAAAKPARASRKYLGLGPDQLVAKMTADDPDIQEKLETQWQGSYVKWQAKYLGHQVGLGEFFNAGTTVEMNCDSLDPEMDMARFGGMKKWQGVTIEARFTRPAALGAKLDQGRAGLVFDDCSVR